MKTRFALLALVFLGCSCSTAGPFVTSISSDGKGNLIIEKSMVHMNPFTGVVSNTAATTSTIRILEPTGK